MDLLTVVAKKRIVKPRTCGARSGTTSFVPCDLPYRHRGKHDVKDAARATRIETETDKFMDMALTALKCERCKKVYGWVEGDAPAGWCSRNCVRENVRDQLQIEDEAKAREAR